MKQVFIMDHPLIQHKLSIIRDKTTGVKEFREVISEIAMLMCYEATRDLPLKEVEIETPVAITRTKVISGKKLAIVPILRAGLGMVDGVQKLIPTARVGHIGVYRDPETHEPVEYYCKMPQDVASSIVIVLDPMFATGGSACAALDLLKKRGCTDLRMVCMVAAPDAIERMHREHPEVPIYCAALDKCLNENAYIVPGLGDAGDRIFGTK
jgi:uracil phosphoribosyltransferase